MKIRLEQTSNEELEIIVKGDINDNETIQVLSLLNNFSDFGKIMMHNENESFIYDANEIIYFESGLGKTYAYTETGKYEVKEKLYELIKRLGSKGFVQINKSTVVNINYIKSISAEFSGNYCARLKRTGNTLTISRKYFNSFKKFIRS